MDAAARCIADPCNPLLITHDVRDMLRQRVYGAWHWAGKTSTTTVLCAVTWVSVRASHIDPSLKVAE